MLRLITNNIFMLIWEGICIKECRIYNSEYIIREDGLVYSKYTNKIINSYRDVLGYAQVVLYIEGKRHHYRVHRLVAEHLLPNPNNFPIVHHKDGNKMNSNINNLEWTTNRENTIHGYAEGRYFRRCGIRGIAINKHTFEEFDFTSLRNLEQLIGVSRKKIAAILKGEIDNNTEYEFIISN